MKKITAILMFTMAFFVATSCSKSDDEHIVDCFGDSVLTELKHTVDDGNPKEIDYSIQYSGSSTLTSVKWTFGDGKTATGTSVTHQYNAAGTYEVKADVTFTKDGSSCTVSPKKSITVN
jgi:chitodextrinase